MEGKRVCGSSCSGSVEQVTVADVERVHLMIETCVEAGMGKEEVIEQLARKGVDARVTDIVWNKLEAENPEFFEMYHTFLRKKQETGQLQRERAVNNGMSRCSSSCSLGTMAAFDNNAAGVWYSCH